MSLVLGGVAWADDISNNLDASIDAAPESISLTTGASTTIELFVQPRNGDGKNGCNLTGSTTLVVSVGSSNSAVATASPSPISFESCEDTPDISVSAIAQGTATISLTLVSNDTGGTFNLLPAAFVVSVTPPPDTTPPVITPTITGTLGNNDWYTSDVTVSWTVDDPESTITSSSGCDPTTINSDNPGTTLTCTATSSGGTASNSVTIKRDATAPTIGGSRSPGPNGDGWNNTDVTVSFSCSDDMSDVASCGPDQTVTADGEDQSVVGTAVDMAGNTATTTVSGINLDKTAPTISGSRIPLANTFGWNNTDVAVSFVCGDSGSGVASCTAPQILTAEGADQSVTGTVTDLAGNSASTTVTDIKIDKANPTISGSASPAPNGNGWNKTNVDVSYTCGDVLSGIVSCGPDETLTTEGEALSSTGTAVDKAGNSASTTVTGIKVDKTAPSIVGSRTPAANSFGWSNSAVTVSFLCSDGLSDIASCSHATQLTTEGASQSVLGVAVDNADNSASTTVSGINIDLTPPTITGSAAPSPNGAGWNNSAVTVSFTCGDLLSGIASCGPDQTLMDDGVGQSPTGTAVDRADNSTSLTVSGINIDQTDPEVVVTGVGQDETYILGSVPTAGCSTTDSLSGVKSQATVTVIGGTSGGVGTFTATCSGAIDVADNTADPVTVTYYVIYDFNGFFRPVDNPPVVNTVKAGSAIPVKFNLSGDQGLDVLALGYPKSSVMACDLSLFSDPIESTVTAGWSSLSYDAEADQYVYVWKTDKSWAGTCRQLVVTLVDGTEHFAYFKFNK